MKKNPLVSIIIPVYNSEKYINRCIQSILSQDYQEIEIILVNDGSKDNSLKLIKKYAQKYDNIKVFTQKNQGPGVARNLGIKKSRGDYITFVDSDDYIEKDYIKILTESVGNNDIIISGYKTIDENMRLINERIPKGTKMDYVKYVSTCCKLYKKDLIVKNNIIFPSRKIGEDVLFTLKCYALTSKKITVKNSGYIIVINKNSITHTISEENSAKLLELVKEIDKTINWKEDEDIYLYFYLKTIILDLLMLPKTLNIKQYYQIYQDSFSWLEKKYNQKSKKIKIKYQKGEEFKINLCVNLFLICRKIHLIKPLLYLIKKCDINL